LDNAAQSAALMARYGVDRKVVTREEMLHIEPSLRHFGSRIVGGTFTASDESGDACAFTQSLAERCAQRGVQFLYGHRVERVNLAGGAVQSVVARPVAADNRGLAAAAKVLGAGQVVVACGPSSAPLLRSVGVNLPIYPGKGYSATFQILNADAAPMVSTIDDAKKIAITRLGDQIRVAGTIEVGGYDLTLTSPLARARCHMLAHRVEEVWPGMCDTRTEEEGGQPQFWAGLRPATPTNIPYIGQTKVRGLWVNAGHGTLGWTHGAGSGKALAELMDGRQPDMSFGTYRG
jgi:D-amino-acid dehydrogenase